MKPMNSLILAAAACLALLAGCSKDPAESGPPVDMKIKWAIGKKYDQQIVMTQKTRTTVPGMSEPMEQNMNMTEDISLTAAKARPSGGAELELKFTNIKMEMKMSGQTMGFDSRQDPKADAGNPAAPMFRKMVGAHVGYLTGADGKVEKVVDYQGFIDQISSGSPEAGAMIKSMFSEDTLKQMGMSSQGLPSKPVRVGESWPFHQEITIGMLGVMVVDMKIKFKGWEEHAGHHCAVLTSTGDVKNRPDNGPAAMKIQIEKGTTEGTTWFAPDLGNVVDCTIDQTMTFKIQAQGQNISSKLIQHINTQLVKVSDAGK
jgi:hypothetical protein